MPAGEPELVRRAQGGDALALEALVARHRNLACAQARGLVLPGGTAEDLRQEALAGLVEAVRRFRPERGPFRAFAAVMCRRACQRAVRTALQRRRMRVTDALPLGGEGTEAAASGPAQDPVHRAIVREELRALGAFVRGGGLSGLERGVLQMSVLGLSYAEQARRLGCTRKAIDNAHQRCQRKIAGRLGESSALLGQAA